MTHHNDPIQQASDRYHACYCDVTYKAIQQAVIVDLYGFAETPEWEANLDQRLSDPIPNRLMNLVTDAASEICQWPGFEGRLIRLAHELVLQRIGWTTIELIKDYLHRFEIPGDTWSADLLPTAQVAQFILKAQPILHEAATTAGDIHTSRGRAVYNLLVAAEQLTRSAQLLVSGEGDLSYISEKITKAADRIASAHQEKVLR